MKNSILILVFTLTVYSGFFAPTLAVEDIQKRRPDNPEFVTETHVRLTTKSLNIAEVTVATPSPTPRAGLLDSLRQSFSAFIQALRDIFNTN